MISHIQKCRSRHETHELITGRSTLKNSSLRNIDNSSLDFSGDASHSRIEPFTFSNYCERVQSASHRTSKRGSEGSNTARHRRERILSEEEEEEICAIVERCLRTRNRKRKRA